jgi:hypothetical protein
MLNHDELLDVLFYDPENGNFIWRCSYNHIKIGDVAGSIRKRKNGYKQCYIKIFGKTYAASRLAWFYVTKVWPDNEIDHRDGNSLNNRWNNLRSATRSQNCFNKGIPIQSKSKTKNVYWKERLKKWEISFKINGKRTYYGVYKDFEMANLIACEIRDNLHGEFARHT